MTVLNTYEDSLLGFDNSRRESSTHEICHFMYFI